MNSYYQLGLPSEFQTLVSASLLNIPRVFLTNISNWSLQLNFWPSFLTPPQPTPSTDCPISGNNNAVHTPAQPKLLDLLLTLLLPKTSHLIYQQPAWHFQNRSQCLSWLTRPSWCSLSFSFTRHLSTLLVVHCALSILGPWCPADTRGTLPLQAFSLAVSSAWNDFLADVLCSVAFFRSLREWILPLLSNLEIRQPPTPPPNS